jgi:chemotaxis protein methyltransferase CheR
MAFTFFFRDRQTLDTIRDHAIPKLRSRRFINIWDAGCAMGPEPYSLAIVLKENMGQMAFRNVRIHATDIDGSNQFGDIIAAGRFHKEQLRSVSKEVLQKHLDNSEAETGFYTISDELRRCVSFQKHDLLSLSPVRTNFSLIICKNVLLHFTQQEGIKVIRMFHQALDEGGYFVTEQTQKLPSETKDLFEPVVSHAQIFRKVSEQRIAYD